MTAVVRGLDKVMLASALLASASLVGMVGVVMVDVTKRALDLPPLMATNEIVQYMTMVALVFLALPITFWRGETISAPLIYDRLSPRLQREFALVSDLLVVVVMLGIGYYGYHEAMHQMEIGESGLISGYSLWWVRFAIPVSAALCIVAVVGRSVTRATGILEGESSDVEVAVREGAL
ncbi:MAG: TRAP transporter small permease [Nocardioides sp.]|nr:TRAP transporter small permease [Nocardioides sp.]